MKNTTKHGGLKHKNNNFKLIATGSATFLFAFATAYLSGSTFNKVGDSYAETIEANVKDTSYFVRVNTNDKVDIDINATLEGALATGTDNLQVETNASAYKIYLSALNDEATARSLYLGGDTTSSFSIAPASVTTLDATNFDTAVELDNNQWGFTMSTDPNPVRFYGVPSKSQASLIAQKDGLTVGSTSTYSHPVTYGVKADLAIPAGTYSSTVVYSIVAEGGGVNAAAATPSVISKDITTGDVNLTVTTSLMTTFDTGDWTVTLIDTADGSHTVDCDNVVVSVPNNNIVLKCTVPASLPGGTYNVRAVNALYGTYNTSSSILRETAGAAFFNITKLQEMTSDVCNSVATPAASAVTLDLNGSHNGSPSGDTAYVPQVTLTDTRTPGSTYIVRKLADGRCWMIDDLKLNLSTSTALIPDNTDVPSAWTPANNTATAAATWTDTTDYSFKSGNTYLYNWYAATAGSGSAGLTDNVATGSICPKGWQLPAKTGTKSFEDLATAYSADASAMKGSPISFNTSGRISGAALTDTGNAYYWGNAASTDSTKAFALTIDASLAPQAEAAKTEGYAIRCVAK